MRDVVTLAQDLVRFNTISPPGNEEACAQFIAGFLEALDFEITFLDYKPQRPNLLARLPGTGETEGVCFSAHVDTVPLGDASWKHDPFASEIDGGRIYGRGTSDMKGGLAAMMIAAASFASNSSRHGDLLFLVSSDEENGCKGVEDLARHSELLKEFKIGTLFVSEPTLNYPWLGHKGICRLKLEATGVTAHSAMPELGENAVYKIARSINKLENFKFSGYQDAVLGSCAMNLGTISGGINVNSVPDSAIAELDIRYTPKISPEEIRDLIQEAVGSEVSVVLRRSAHPVLTNPSDQRVKDVFSLYRTQFGRLPEPKGAPYYTDGACLKSLLGDPATFILGPGDPGQAHKTDEYIDISCLKESVELYSSILEKFLLAA